MCRGVYQGSVSAWSRRNHASRTQASRAERMSTESMPGALLCRFCARSGSAVDIVLAGQNQTAQGTRNRQLDKARVSCRYDVTRIHRTSAIGSRYRCAYESAAVFSIEPDGFFGTGRDSGARLASVAYSVSLAGGVRAYQCNGAAQYRFGGSQ